MSPQRRVRSAEHLVLGRAVREVRARFDLSQESLSFASGLHRNCIGAIERGEINPTFRVLLRLSNGLTVPLSVRVPSPRSALVARGRLHTTTIRFDADTWATIVAESDRLGIAHAGTRSTSVARCCGMWGGETWSSGWWSSSGGWGRRRIG